MRRWPSSSSPSSAPISRTNPALPRSAASAEPSSAGHQIAAWHRAKFTNGPTEAINNLIERVKRIAFGITNWTNYRTRSLLYAGKPNAPRPQLTLKSEAPHA
ncbi:transposase [Ilumatobacter sp.]|uniref:transposase n=1 Tax=Ilumatobacter sp. TaxID=1967498 RepID=UPI003B5277DA